ncbi:hypothetical protein [Amycolatopsis sp. NPDC059657]|uniref:SDH family Clp fold serine proteinase n=1 Tax=Amycolatopsis sp. NPDC059657 TaxID=3346899 RepID=UPI00366F3A0F
MTSTTPIQGYGAQTDTWPVATGLGISRHDRHHDEMSIEDRVAVLGAGKALTAKTGDEAWLLITGQFEPFEDEHKLTENLVKESCRRVFGYPPTEARSRTINVLLDSRGGMLDSAYRIVLYLSWYATDLHVYVPRRAKSASTLVALGADQVHLSPFGELGPLDTQIGDPRNPTTTVSALDCYQSVDYVRQFGFTTMSASLARLIRDAEGQIPLNDLLGTASEFAIGSITPMLQGIRALDFGGWGRSLKIGEQYAKLLLLAKNPDEDRAARISERLVYGYTHHPFPIDYREATRIGLEARKMDESIHDEAMAVVEQCRGRSFVGFISSAEAEIEQRKTPPAEHAEPLPNGQQPELVRQAAMANQAELS